MSIDLNVQGLWEETARLYNTVLVPTCNVKLTGEGAKTRAENGDLVLRQAFEHVYREHSKVEEG